MKLTVDNAQVINHKIALADSTQLQDCLDWSWQKVTANNVDNVEHLASLLNLNPAQLSRLITPYSCDQSSGTVLSDFKLSVPLTFISRMQSGDLTDPLLLQVLPQKSELIDGPEYSNDPLNERAYNVVPGLVHKYTGRVLLTAAVSCPINCRYCFRRHFPYDENRLTPSNWSMALDYIRTDSSIKEVILSGGEPLLLNDRMLSQLLSEIESIQHVRHIRIHSRFPIVVPQRLTETLCSRLIASPCNVALVLHSNHANEIDSQVKAHLYPLVNSQVTVLNQSVLLEGINNNVDTLCDLSETLFDAGILPYYLHATDPVVGTAHFQVSDERAKQIALELTHRLPGYLVPTLVREVSGELAKTRLPLD